MRTSATTILTVFCVLIFLQIGCAGGWLTHCVPHSGHDSELDSCPQDYCREGFSFPGKSVLLGTHPGSLTALPLVLTISATAANLIPPSHCQIVTANCSHPAGSFPLLI